MAFLRSSFNCTQFMCTEPIPQDFWDTFAARLQQYAFRDIDESREERSFGWVDFEDFLDTTWEKPYTVGEYICFALRLDTRRLSPAVFKKYYTLRLREEYAALSAMGKQYLGKERKQELKEQVRLQLFGKSLPIPAHFQVVWSLRKGRIYLDTVQPKVVHLFTEYFIHSFNITIVQTTPLEYAYALSSESDIAAIEGIQASSFLIEAGR